MIDKGGAKDLHPTSDRMHPAPLSQKNVDKKRGNVQDNIVCPVGYPVKGRQDNGVFKSLKRLVFMCHLIKQ